MQGPGTRWRLGLQRWVFLAAFLALVAPACAGPGPGSSSVTPTSNLPPVASEADFDPANFSNPTAFTNPWLPLVAGTRYTLKGHFTDEGERIPREVITTVTDLTKVVNGVRTLVAWEQDITDGQLEESDISFYAQDDDGNIWYFGEYPEEYEGKEIVKTPTWIAGLHGARAGIMMPAVPRLNTPSYAEGWGGTDVNWNDRGKVDQVGKQVCVPVDCYTDVLVIDEFNPGEPGADQLKFYAPEVGGIRVGWRGANEQEREVLELVSLERLGAAQMEEVRKTVLAQEARAYRISPDVYGTTDPIDRS